jgi:hypothetical protein
MKRYFLFRWNNLKTSLERRRLTTHAPVGTWMRWLFFLTHLNGKKVLKTDQHGRTPLMTATRGGYVIELFEMLMDASECEGKQKEQRARQYLGDPGVTDFFQCRRRRFEECGYVQYGLQVAPLGSTGAGKTTIMHSLASQLSRSVNAERLFDASKRTVFFPSVVVTDNDFANWQLHDLPVAFFLFLFISLSPFGRATNNLQICENLFLATKIKFSFSASTLKLQIFTNLTTQ